MAKVKDTKLKAKLRRLETQRRKAPLGKGKRFAALEEQIELRGRGKKGRKKIKSPGALAAMIGRKKYGRTKMAQMAAAGRKRKA